MSEISWPRAAVLALAVGFLGFSLALYLGRDQPADSTSVDVGFYQDMIYHHDQALEMSLLELANGSEPTVLAFAKEILTQQSWEMGVMERSLEEWGSSSRDSPDEAMEWMGMPMPVEQMTGLATDEQLAELREADGEEADALFLEMMAEHHLGGIHMAEYAASNAENDHVRELARRQAHVQAQEVNEFATAAERLDLPVAIDLVPVPQLDQG